MVIELEEELLEHLHEQDELVHKVISALVAIAGASAEAKSETVVSLIGCLLNNVKLKTYSCLKHL